MTKAMRVAMHGLAIVVIPSEAKRGREWSGWGSRDIDGKTGG